MFWVTTICSLFAQYLYVSSQYTSDLIFFIEKRNKKRTARITRLTFSVHEKKWIIVSSLFAIAIKKKRGRKEIEYKYTSALDESHCQDLLTLRFFIVKNNRIISIAPTTMSNLLVTIVFLCSLVGEITSYTCSCYCSSIYAGTATSSICSSSSCKSACYLLHCSSSSITTG